ncbi:MFS transporter [Breznakia pachnodae]|uniref:Major facilitator superfamily (MFS) profile domain-containing protein n=1 Tax=Breznakia pachnodae TaxID=265178 RepID=A0ABU0DY26_9FIRM|nr:MFS transporter [Breznakia pachnodae]MDQ0359545.1 hypothetical protein [Breznakia pachnodae]
MKTIRKDIINLKDYLVLWSTQFLSTLGSSMTSFALILWSYQAEGSALTTAILSVCSYVPYILMSMISGVISDKWNKILVLITCDSMAAICTIITLKLLSDGNLEIWHLYCLNAVNGFMSSLQSPVSEVVISLLVPQEYYQKTSGLQSLSNSLSSIITPMLAAALLSFGSMQLVIMVDLTTFIIATLTLLFFVKIPKLDTKEQEENISFTESAKLGLNFLKEKKGIFYLMLFLAMINLTASMYNAALPALILSKMSNGVVSLGTVQTVSGVALLIGSLITTVAPKPRSRVRVICNTLLISMSTENFFLAFGNSTYIWSVGALIGWICIPLMSANMNVIFREQIPIHLQGRVFSIRNAFQFFTIPIGYFLGGFLVDYCFEPFMKNQQPNSLLTQIFGAQKGSGAALLFLVLAVLGIATCLIFRKNKEIWKLEE